MWVGKFALSDEGLPAGGVAWIDLGTTAASSYSTVNGASYHKTYSSPDGISALYVTTEAIAASDTSIGGFRYRKDGVLRVYDATAAVPAGSNTNQGIALTSDGQLCYTTGNTTSFNLNGVAVDSSRRVYAAPLAFELQFADAGAGVVTTTEAITAATPTFTRATASETILSNATYGQVASGSPISYYSPSGVYLGYYAQGARTNLCQRGSDFANVWTDVGTPTLSADTTARGTLSLSTIGDDSAAALEGKIQTVTFTGDAVKAISLFVKQGTATSSVIRLRDTSAPADRLLAAITWSGTTPVVTMTTGTDLTGTPEQYGSSGVYRLMFATSSVTAANTNSLEIYPATDAALDVAAVGTIQAGGVQAENATFPGIWIPTPGSATVARNADVLTYPTSPWLNAAAGTMFAQFSINTSSAGTRIFQVDDGTTNEQIRILTNTTTGSAQIIDGGVAVMNTTPLTGATNMQSVKMALAYAVNDGASCANGGTVATDATVSLPTVTTANIGQFAAQCAEGPIRRVSYYAARLANATLQGLTG